MTINIETENAGTYPDVDEAQLLEVSNRLADGMKFLIVHDAARPNEYAQAAGAVEATPPHRPKPGRYVVEYCTSDDRHYQAEVDSTERVGGFLVAWALQHDGWHHGYDWKQLQL